MSNARADVGAERACTPSARTPRSRTALLVGADSVFAVLVTVCFHAHAGHIWFLRQLCGISKRSHLWLRSGSPEVKREAEVSRLRTGFLLDGAIKSGPAHTRPSQGQCPSGCKQLGLLPASGLTYPDHSVQVAPGLGPFPMSRNPGCVRVLETKVSPFDLCLPLSIQLCHLNHEGLVAPACHRSLHRERELTGHVQARTPWCPWESRSQWFAWKRRTRWSQG